MFENYPMLQKILFVIYMPIMWFMALGLPALWCIAIYKKKYMVNAELLLWKHDRYSSNIICDIGLSNLSGHSVLVTDVYIKPAYSCDYFTRERYKGEVWKVRFPTSLSSLQKKKISISFPIDLSNYYAVNEKNTKANKPWLLILKTNHLERAFTIDAPF